MIIRNRGLTAREAAEEFAKQAYDEPREIGQLVLDDPKTGRSVFKLVNGIWEYDIKLHPEGWEVRREDQW